jgi:hypothetical protein
MQIGIKYWAIDFLNTDTIRYIYGQRYLTLVKIGKYNLNILYGLKKNAKK